MEYRNGIAKIAMYAGIASRRSFHSTFTTCWIIRNPTITSAGAVAKLGMARKIGEKNSASRKKRPDTTAVRPVRPPSAIPELDSTKVVMVEVPRQAPTMVPMESASSAPLISGSLPSSSSMSALEAQPIRVPSVSKISTNRNANSTEKKSSGCSAMMEKSNLNRVGAIDAGMETTPDGIRL